MAVPGLYISCHRYYLLDSLICTVYMQYAGFIYEDPQIKQFVADINVAFLQEKVQRQRTEQDIQIEHETDIFTT